MTYADLSGDVLALAVFQDGGAEVRVDSLAAGGFAKVGERDFPPSALTTDPP
jgi:hypothetical protein